MVYRLCGRFSDRSQLSGRDEEEEEEEVLGDGFLPHYRSFADLVLALIRGNRPVRAGVCLYVCVSVLVCCLCAINTEWVCTS